MILNNLTSTLMEREGFFESTLNFFETLWAVISNVFSSIITAFNYLISIERIPTLVTSFLPSFVSGMVIIVIGVCIVNYIIGR